MKIYSKFILLFFAAGILFGFKPNKPQPGDISGKITMSGAFALYPLAVKWGEEFKKLHPNVTFDIQGGGAGKGMTDVLSGNVTLGMVSREIAKEETAKGAIGFAVCKDAVVATMNINNPYYAKIYETGITKRQFYELWVGRGITTWGELLKNGAKEKVTVFTRSDAAGAADAWAKYIGNKKQDDLEGIGVFGDPGLATAVANDKFSVGYNNVGYAYDFKTKKPNPGIGIIPIDLNENGKLDPQENFYSNADKLNMAVIADIYPSPPARVLYFVTKGTPTDAATIEFLKWTLTDGQKYVAESGFVELTTDLLKQQLTKLPK
ncbi:MAG: substrate-binding domain-containing protein [Fimbriimonadaceae bacterium]|nr:substrate-binding domain-containing protein [Chitinophagales bacterium]